MSYSIFSKHEEKIISDYYRSHGLLHVVEEFRRAGYSRTKESIRSKAYNMGQRRTLKKKAESLYPPPFTELEKFALCHK